MRSLAAAKADLVAHQRRIEEARTRLAELWELVRATHASHQQHTASALKANEQTIVTGVRRAVPIENRGWDDPDWRSWQPRAESAEIERTASIIRAGHLRDIDSGTDLATIVALPLVGRGRPVVILSRTPEQQRVARALLQSLVLRAAALLPHRARFYLLDPAGQGAAFPMARHLGDALVDTTNQAEALETLRAEIRRVNHEYLDAAVPALHLVPAHDRPNERYQLLFAADYPAFYDPRSVALVQNIAGAGPRAGVYAFVHHHLDPNLSHDALRARISDPQVVDLQELEQPSGVGRHEAREQRFPPFRVQMIWDGEPDAAIQRAVLTRITDLRPVPRGLQWGDLAQPGQESWWQGDATERISAPIARQGGGRNIQVTFGTDERGQEIAHGLLVAMSGAGKTALLHTLITGLAVRYSPDELRFRLLDGKVGVEFRAYSDLPHAEVVSLNTRPELARSVLDDLVRELVDRNELFKRAGVNSFPAYRRAGSPAGRLPRLLLVADEYQVLFEGDRDQVAASALRRLSDQGRSAGIHMLLGSQHFAPANMPYRHDIFANFHLRLAMQMVRGELMTSGDFGSEGRKLIGRVCDGVGKVVVSDRPGDDSNYQAGSTAYLDPGRRDALIGALAGERHSGRIALVLDGDRQPEVAESRVLPALARAALRDSPGRRQALARERLREPDWALEEHPLALVLGLPFTIAGETFLVLRRRPAENVAIIGTQAAERTAMVASSLLSACLQLSPGELQIAVADRSVHPGEGVLERALTAAARSGYPVSYGRDDDTFGRLLSAALVEADRRSVSGALDEPLRLIVLSEPNRVSPLLQQPGRFENEESELGKVLRRILEVGPAVGVHTVLAIGSVGELGSVLDPRRVAAVCRHRIAMQMSEPDSFAIVRSNAAARLQPDGQRPIAALLFDQQADRATRFRPWALDGLSRQIEEALGTLA